MRTRRAPALDGQDGGAGDVPDQATEPEESPRRGALDRPYAASEQRRDLRTSRGYGVPVLKAWRKLPGTPSEAVLVRPCPRCGADVRLTGFGPSGPGYGPPLYRPTVLHVVRVCGCTAPGRPPVPEWEKRRRRPQATYW